MTLLSVETASRRSPRGLERPWAGVAIVAALVGVLLGCAGRPPGTVREIATPAVAGAPPTSIPLAAPRELLNSERIAARFGSYGVAVLAASDTLRLSNLFSHEPGDANRRTCRTLAIVHFAGSANDPLLAREHQRILAGGSLGAVLTAAGWRVAKHPLQRGEIGPPRGGSALHELMRLGERPGAPPRLAVNVYALAAERDGHTIPYATLAEVYHPDYLTLADLEALLGPPPAATPAVPETASTLPAPDVTTLLALAGRATRDPLDVLVAATVATPAAGEPPGTG
jgi:hypothetical protein